MSLLTDASPLPGDLLTPGPLDEPEDDELLRITGLVEHLFRVPIAYLALFGSALTVVRRLGSGREHWDSLRTFPMDAVRVRPMMWPDPAGRPAHGFRPGDLRFAASAPLRSSDGMELGVLVIADLRPRPDFAAKDLESFAELARVLAGKLELRMIAAGAREAESAIQETERRFRNIANAAPVLIIYSGADGASLFVNKTWLDFTGRTMEEEVAADGFVEMFHPDHREAVMRKYWDAFQARRPHSQEFLMRRHDGIYRWMRSSGVPRFRGDGVFAGYIGCFADVTEERSARGEIRRQKLASAALAAAAGVFYLILDREGTIQDMGPGVEADLRQHLFWEVCGSGDGAALRAAFARAVAGAGPVELVLSSPFPTGQTAERRWAFTPLAGDDAVSIVLATVELIHPGV